MAAPTRTSGSIGNAAGVLGTDASGTDARSAACAHSPAYLSVLDAGQTLGIATPAGVDGTVAVVHPGRGAGRRSTGAAARGGAEDERLTHRPSPPSPSTHSRHMQASGGSRVPQTSSRSPSSCQIIDPPPASSP